MGLSALQSKQWQYFNLTVVALTHVLSIIHSLKGSSNTIGKECGSVVGDGPIGDVQSGVVGGVVKKTESTAAADSPRAQQSISHISGGHCITASWRCTF